MRVQQKDLLGVVWGLLSFIALIIYLFICAGRATIHPLAMSPSPCCRSWCAERNLGQLLCLLSGVKSRKPPRMSASDPKRTFGLRIVATQNDGRTPRDSHEQTRSNPG